MTLPLTLYIITLQQYTLYELLICHKVKVLVYNSDKKALPKESLFISLLLLISLVVIRLQNLFVNEHKIDDVL